MICIAGIFIAELHKSNTLSRLMLSAFLFSWIGDILLMSDASLFFILGLSAFLIAHIIYIIAFTKSLRQKKNTLLKQKFYLALSFYLVAAIIFVILQPHLLNLMIPVLFYTLILTTMVVSALNLYGQIPKKAWLLILAGAFLFMISDTSLAFNKFYSPLPFSNLIIMSTYVAAQYLIMKGTLTWLNENTKNSM